MTEQTIKEFRERLLAAADHAAAAMDFALAVFNPKDIEGNKIEIADKHTAKAVHELETALWGLRLAKAQYDNARASGGGMTRVITPGPVE